MYTQLCTRLEKIVEKIMHHVHSTESYMLTYKRNKNMRIIEYLGVDCAGCKPSYGSIYDAN